MICNQLYEQLKEINADRTDKQPKFDEISGILHILCECLYSVITIAGFILKGNSGKFIQRNAKQRTENKLSTCLGSGSG